MPTLNWIGKAAVVKHHKEVPFHYSAGTYSITCPSGRVIEAPPKGMYWRVSKVKLEELDRDNRSILQIATDKHSIVLDSFAGSGITAHAVLKQNAEDGGNRRFILVEMGEGIAQNVTAERVWRVAEGYTNAKGQAAEGLGGSFQFCRLSTKPLFDADPVFEVLPKFAGPKVIYAAANRMGGRAAREGITFKQTPYALEVQT